MFPVSHLHATFGVGLNKKRPLFMHGATEQGLVSSSDPSTGRVDNWGLADFQAFRHFADVFAGEPEFGLGPGNVVGMSNVLDVSQPLGKVYGEACPGGRLYYTATFEQRGRFLEIKSTADHAQGIPDAPNTTATVCSVWIAKSEAVLKITKGIFGILAGFSDGVVSAFALGSNPVYERRFEKGEPTAKWVVCPGVPVIAITVDDNVSRRRVEGRRIWATLLNALGEVFVMKDVPVRPDAKGKMSVADQDRIAWQTGRTVEWCLVEATRRTPKPDPYDTSSLDGSYTPRISSDSAGLSTEQRAAEMKEVEAFMRHKPKHFQSICEGWDMERRLMVDYAGDDRRGAGEAIFVVTCGMPKGQTASIKRVTRCRRKISMDYDLEAWPSVEQANPHQSIFGEERMEASSPAASAPRSRTSSTDITDTKYDETWYTSNYSFGDLRQLQLSANAADESEFATLAVSEDPLLGMTGGSNSSSPIGSPLNRPIQHTSPSDIPGQRARLMAVGTKSGVVLLWDMRGALGPAVDVVNTIYPVRVIYTRSPQISSLALTALYVVHGGNDGLVQAWDPLASTTEPIRTLNSRFSDRARRRIAQADASVHGVGHNYFAAGAIVLDQDPTVLRGMVSLGTHLRYWSYSASAADAYKSKKRGQLRRRSERGSNAANADHKVTATGRGMLKDYILKEQMDLERDKAVRRKETERISGRFGTDLLGAGASDTEMLAYATMLSEEAWASDEVKREASEDDGLAATFKPNHAPHSNDTDIEEAIRLSLAENEQPTTTAPDDFNIPIRYAKPSKHSTGSPRNKAGGSGLDKGYRGDSDLEFALQLSLAEERSRLDEADFPPLAVSSSPDSGDSGSGKGKGKSRRK